jgi:hypothetical protein
MPSAETAVIIRIDLRKGAAGPDAMDAGSIHEGTLEELQYRALSGAAAQQPGLADIPLLLVVDDTDEFPQHTQALQYLLEAPTFGEMICVIVGPPAAPPQLDVPPVLEFHRVPVLWIGDPRGVGWRIGLSKPDRLAVDPADPDGAKTIAALLDILMVHDLYRQVSEALSRLPSRLGAPALLPWLHWPASPASNVASGPPAAGVTASQAQPAPAPQASATLAPPERHRNPLIRFLRWLLGLLGLRRHSSPPPVQNPTPIGPAPVPPAKPPAPVSDEDLARAQWLMSAAANDKSFRQLCSARQAIMLGDSSGLVSLVRFAPAAARQLIGCPLRDGDFIAWTSGEIVGVIRLVPVRDGLLHPAAS